MSSKYLPSRFEKKWRERWKRAKLHTPTKDSVPGKKNKLILTEFPYPSGNLHIGHWDAFALPDMLVRFERMRGKNVLYPIGFDAFGLPAENAAIKRGLNPRAWTEKNIKYMTTQLETMGASFDWSRVVSTIDPEYYRWTQWMFLKMFEKKLAYRAETVVNWCPKDKTVLANEQVVNGLCERCDTPVEQKMKEQWMFKITEYADRLYDDVDALDWPHATKVAQKNWIGKSNGATLTFTLRVPGQGERHAVSVFTTRADTLFGVTFIVISPELAKQWLSVGWQASEEAKKYIEMSLKKKELERLQEGKEKTGVFSGVMAVHPGTHGEIPVWVADYVLGSYGTGAVMGVPAHDERDFEFAQKFNLPIKNVITPEGIEGEVYERMLRGELCYGGEGVLRNSQQFDGLSITDAKTKVVNTIGGQKTTTYKLRDWILSRQRYWGVPIPIVRCATCGYVPAQEKDLPIKLPVLKDFLPTDDGRSPLAKAKSWVQVKCPTCKKPAERETDTMDTFVDSSWYYLRYTDPKNKKTFADTAKMKKWLPVPLYIGGAEHNTMHLLYSRFFAKVFHDLGYLSFDEPFVKRVNHGIILGPNGQKMSKSRDNVIDPDLEVKKYGSDTVRMYLAFMAPYEQGGPWDPKGIMGVHRFLARVYAYGIRVGKAKKISKTKTAKELELVLHQTIKKVGEDLEAMKFNTAVSTLMIALNELEKKEDLEREFFKTFLKLLAPLAPHLADELWSVLGHKKSIHLEKWPSYNEKKLVGEFVTIVVQVGGKVRASLQAPRDITEVELTLQAGKLPELQKWLEGRTPKRVIFVPNRLINLVLD